MKKIAYVNDIHLDEKFPEENGADTRKNWKIVLDDIRKRGINYLVVGGDIGEFDTNEYFFSSLGSFSIDLTLGNHDRYDQAIKYFNNVPSAGEGELYYSYSDEFMKYIFLDSSMEELGESQLGWLEKEILTEKNLVIFIHHPVLAVDTAVDKKYPLKNRDKVKELLFQYSKEVLVFCAHYHLEDERAEKNVRQFITPAVSYQIKKNPEEIIPDAGNFGYRIITIEKGKLSSEIILFDK